MWLFYQSNNIRFVFTVSQKMLDSQGRESTRPRDEIPVNIHVR